MKKRALAAAVVLAASLLSSGAFAQEQAGGTVGGSVQTSTPPVVTAKPLVSASAPASVDESTPDHDRFIGRFAVGYLGLNDLPMGGIAATAGAPGGGGLNLAEQRVVAPTIGARYWLNRTIGIDAGLGFGVTGGSSETVVGGTSTTVDSPSAFGLAIHGGVPLAFAHGKHYSFLVVPEMNLGFTSGTIKQPNAADIDLSGFRFDLGGRVGSEIHFGFIGVPELSLQASVGLFFEREAFKAKTTNAAGATVSASTGRSTFGTTVQADPWALFTHSISAFYYF